MAKGAPQVSKAAAPLVRLLEDYRICCDVSTRCLSEALGITRLSYYNWLKGKCEPKPASAAQCRLVGTALKRASENGELPIFRELGLTANEREAKIKAVLFGYIELLIK